MVDTRAEIRRQLRLGRILKERGETDTALGCYETAYSLDPRYARHAETAMDEWGEVGSSMGRGGYYSHGRQPLGSASTNVQSVENKSSKERSGSDEESLGYIAGVAGVSFGAMCIMTYFGFNYLV